MQISGGALEGAKFEAALSFPRNIKAGLTRWRVGFSSTIDDKDVDVIQGSGTGGLLVTMYFDSQSGLLVRLLRYVNSPVGRTPTQIDYSDYREVAGVKMPFKWKTSWLDGKENFELKEIQTNVAIDPKRFEKP
jgi:hypothetical protein